MITWPHTDHLCPSAPRRNQRLISHFLAIDSSLGAQVQPDNAHPCCDQLTAVKTGYPLTSNNLAVPRAQVSAHRGRVFFEVIRWQVTSFQMITGSSSFLFEMHRKQVVLMSRTYNIVISNWPRTRKLSQFLQIWKAVTFDSPWLRVGHALCAIFMLWMVKIRQASSCGKFMQHLETCLLIAEADRV